MKKTILGTLTKILVFVFATSITSVTYAQQKELQQIVGNIICLQVDAEGNLRTLTEFTECSGTMILVGDEKSYLLQGSDEDVMKFLAEHKGQKRTVDGIIEGHERGWILASASAVSAPDDMEAKVSVEGTIVCLLPNYAEGSVMPFVAAGDCSEKESHLHVVHTKDGQVYALHGSEEAVANLQREDKSEVSLEGKVQGGQGAWILYVK